MLTKSLLAAVTAAVLMVPAPVAARPAEAAGGTDSGATAQPAAATHAIGYDRYSLSIDGRRVWLWSAE